MLTDEQMLEEAIRLSLLDSAGQAAPDTSVAKSANSPAPMQVDSGSNHVNQNNSSSSNNIHAYDSASEHDKKVAEKKRKRAEKLSKQPNFIKNLYNLTFGTDPDPLDVERWEKAVFEFSKDTRFGLVQVQGGPCGILAAVQALILKNVLFTPQNIKHCGLEQVGGAVSSSSSGTDIVNSPVTANSSQQNYPANVVPQTPDGITNMLASTPDKNNNNLNVDLEAFAANLTKSQNPTDHAAEIESLKKLEHISDRARLTRC